MNRERADNATTPAFGHAGKNPDWGDAMVSSAITPVTRGMAETGPSAATLRVQQVLS
jgi:hypothetical protein